MRMGRSRNGDRVLCLQSKEGEESEEILARFVHDAVCREYKVLESMVYDADFRKTSPERERFSQPWAGRA